MKKATHNLRGLADELGSLRAKKADLIVREKAITKTLIDAGATILEDDLFRVNLVRSERTTIDWKAIAARLKPSRQLVSAHTSSKPVVSVRTSSRIGDVEAA